MARMALVFFAVLGIVVASLVSIPDGLIWAQTPGQSTSPSVTYVVQPGDSLSSIATRFGVSVSRIALENGVANPNLIYSGQLLSIPDDSPVLGAADAPAQAPAPSGPAAPAMTEREAGMLQAINGQRVAAGLAQLAFDPTLLPLAKARSDDMATRNYFSHTTPEGRTLQDMAAAAHLPYKWTSEILARNNYPDDQSVAIAVNAFMQSEAHRAHILYPAYRRAAVAEARTASGMKYFTVILATD